LASRWFQIVLALEVEKPWWPADGAAGDTPADPGDEHRQCTLERAAHPRRASQARHRYWPVQRCQVYGQKTTAAVARLEDIPSQSCGWDRCDGYVRGSNDLVPPSLWLVNPAARSARDPVAWSYRTSDCGMDRRSICRGLRLGTNSSISDPGSGWRLRRSLPPATSITGYSRSTNIAALTLAKTDTLNDSSAQSDGNVLITL